MRIIANENFPLDAVEALRKNGFDVIWIRSDCPGLPDEEVFRRARKENCCIATFDKDFGELAFHSKLPAPCGVILFRIQMPSSKYMTRFVVQAIKSRNDWSGHFSVITENQIRMKPLPQ